jgi:hypothetical protein
VSTGEVGDRSVMSQYVMSSNIPNGRTVRCVRACAFLPGAEQLLKNQFV